MAAPLPAPEPPPAIAPPAAPTTAPATAPMAPSFTVSMVLSRLGTREAACWLHAAMTDCVGTDGDDDAVAALRGVVRTDDVASAALLLSEPLPDKLATTSPVASAVTTTRAMATAVSFQGLFQSRLLMIRSSCAPGAPAPLWRERQFKCHTNQALNGHRSGRRVPKDGKTFRPLSPRQGRFSERRSCSHLHDGDVLIGEPARHLGPVLRLATLRRSHGLDRHNDVGKTVPDYGLDEACEVGLGAAEVVHELVGQGHRVNSTRVGLEKRLPRSKANAVSTRGARLLSPPRQIEDGAEPRHVVLTGIPGRSYRGAKRRYARRQLRRDPRCPSCARPEWVPGGGSEDAGRRRRRAAS